MLSNIKNLINSKKAYMEATKLILENEELDDSIVLNEEPVEPEIKEDETIEVSTDEEPVVEPTEQPLPVPGEEVPSDNTEVQVDDDNSDLLTAEIDLTTNTQVDSLPVPPSNASDAIVGDDFMDQTIDSGFGNEEEKAPIETTEDIMAEPVDDQSEKVEETIDESKTIDDEDLMAMSLDEILDELKNNKEDDSEHKEESTDIMNDLIGDDGEEKAHKEGEEQFKKVASEEQATESTDIMTEAISVGDEAPAEGSEEPAPDSTETPAEEDNTVTAAVKDKVDEISTDNTVDGTSTPAFSSKEELMKKLSSLTKSLEDAKSLVMGEMK